MKNKVFTVILLVITFNHLKAQTIISIYEGKAPGSENWDWEQKETANNPYHTRVLYNISKPTLVAYLPPASSAIGTAVIIAPGGGFRTVGVDYEAGNIAKWLNSKGITAFVLRYRLVHVQTDEPFAEVRGLDRKKLDSINAPVLHLAIADGLKAVEYVRTHAEEFNISPKRIGMMGFSAGATLTMGTVYRGNASNRPDFAAPLYANMNNLKDESVPVEAPPLFICSASDDELIPASHSSNLYNSWIAAKKQAELHMYEKGGHGFGSRKQNLPIDSWTERFEEWLDSHDWLPLKPL